MKHDDDHCDNLKPDAMDCLKRGHRQLAQGVYVCADGDLHLNGPELCKAAGYPPTWQNMEILAREAMKLFGGPGTLLVVE